MEDTGTGKSGPSPLHSLIPEPPPPCTGVSTDMYVCAHTPGFTMLQEFQQEVIASVRHDVPQEPWGVRRMTLEGLEGGEEGQMGFWRAFFGVREQLPGCPSGIQEGRVPRHSRGGDDLIPGSADQQHRALVPSEDSTVGGDLRAGTGETDCLTPALAIFFFQALLGDPCCARHEPY